MTFAVQRRHRPVLVQVEVMTEEAYEIRRSASGRKTSWLNHTLYYP